MVFNDPSPLWQAWQRAKEMVKNCGYESIYFNDIKASGDFVNRGFKTILITDTLEEAQNLKSKFEEELLHDDDYIINFKPKKRLKLLIKLANAQGEVQLSVTDVPHTEVMTKAKMPKYIKDVHDFEREILYVSRLSGIKDEERRARIEHDIQPLLNEIAKSEKKSLELLNFLADNINYNVTYTGKGKAYRLTYYDPVSNRRHQESLGNIFIFAGKPTMGQRRQRKERSDRSKAKIVVEFPFGAYVWK